MKEMLNILCILFLKKIHNLKKFNVKDFRIILGKVLCYAVFFLFKILNPFLILLF